MNVGIEPTQDVIYSIIITDANNTRNMPAINAIMPF